MPLQTVAVDASANSKCSLLSCLDVGLTDNHLSLALAEMKMLLRAVYSRFLTVPDPRMTQRDMGMDDQLISSRPLGQRCLLQFIPV